jgi:EAL domain-containing protein (putative c-di-GMP-specific phosphodiesterase class I)
MARTVTDDLNRQRVPLSLDDFGSGHSSLLHLQHIPLGTLKVDIGFVHDIDTNDRAKRLLKALLGLGRELGLNVIAEGVERASQCEVLRSLGCPMAQGHYFAPPVPASGVLALLAERGQWEQPQRPTAPARRAATLN